MQKTIASSMLIGLLAGCTTMPSGPSTLALPGQNTTEVHFRQDEKACRTFGHQELLNTPHKPQTLDEAQLHFDINYLQCMYTKGHLIPISGEILTDKTGSAMTPPPERPPSH